MYQSREYDWKKRQRCLKGVCEESDGEIWVNNVVCRSPGEVNQLFVCTH